MRPVQSWSWPRAILRYHGGSELTLESPLPLPLSYGDHHRWLGPPLLNIALPCPCWQLVWLRSIAQVVLVWVSISFCHCMIWSVWVRVLLLLDPLGCVPLYILLSGNLFPPSFGPPSLLGGPRHSWLLRGHIWGLVMFYHLSRLFELLNPACDFDGLGDALHYLGRIPFSNVWCLEFLYDRFQVTGVIEIVACLNVGWGQLLIMSATYVGLWISYLCLLDWLGPNLICDDSGYVEFYLVPW